MSVQLFKSKKIRLIMCLLMMIFVLGTLLFGCSVGGKKAGSQGDSSNNQDVIHLKVGHVLAPTHPYQLGLEKFAKLVDQKTGGKVKIEIFHSSQLGNEREMIEALQMGTLDMTICSTAPLAGFSNSFLVFDLPYVFKSRENAYKVVDSEVGMELLKSLENNGIKGLAYWETGYRNITTANKPIIHPNDMKGIKIRTVENKIHMAAFKQVGADPTPIPFGELFTALQQGVVDAQENPLSIIFTSNFYEVQKYLAMTEHLYGAAPLLMSKQRWDSLSPEIQKALQEAAIEARSYERECVKKMDGELLETLKSKGMQVTQVDKEEWRQAMLPVYKQFEDQIGTSLLKKVIELQK